MDHLDRGCFPGAVWSKQPENLPMVYRQRDMVDRGEPPECFRKLLDVNDRLLFLLFFFKSDAALEPAGGASTHGDLTRVP